MIKTYVKIFSLILILATTASCAHMGMDRLAFWDRGDKKAAAGTEETTEAAAPEAPAVDREALLRGQIQEYIQQVSGDENRLVRRRPYYFKEYSVYPSGAESADISVTETDSRLRPYVATVKLEKQRFSTRLHRDRDEAVGDSEFIRDTGTETLSYEWSGDRWTKSGSFFVASATEQQVDGQWVAVQATEKRTVATEEENARGGILSRIFSTILGD